MQNRQPKICPMTNYRKGFPGHEAQCPHGPNYVKECTSFSSWFWYKVAQFQVEPITEEKIPREILQKIYGKGWNDAMKSNERVVVEPNRSTIYHPIISDRPIQCVVCGKGIIAGDVYYLDGLVGIGKTCEECHGEWDDDIFDGHYGAAKLSMSTPRALQLLEDVVMHYFKRGSYEEVAEAEAMHDFIVKHLAEYLLVKKEPVVNKPTP